MILENKVALITGAASGLGLATTAAFIKQGGKVLMVDRNEAALAQASQPFTDQALPAVVDVTDEKSVSEAVAAACKQWGALHIAVNCAGVGMAGRTLGKTGPFSLSVFKQVIEINLVGTFNVLRLAAEAMVQNDPADNQGERGVIINTASVAAFEGQIGQAAYSASKAGVVGMTLPVARDLARDQIRVNTIAPGVFNTPLMNMAPEPMRARLAEQTVFPERLGEPEEYAALAVHMVENSYLNGETVRLDAGIRMAAK
ncbi:MAG TPA: 3-hydroxyacyl-CoA dehydrogenase [Gammaproteobacteria bacterium]|nr:3-hydroxyacyl-CoA dehydrogenase [Gammaproteobacteria bacterium]